MGINVQARNVFVNNVSANLVCSILLFRFCSLDKPISFMFQERHSSVDGEVLVMLCVIFACFSVYLIDSANLWHLQQLVSYLLMSCCRSQSLQEFPKYSDWKKPRGIMSQTFAEFVERLPSSKA